MNARPPRQAAKPIRFQLSAFGKVNMTASARQLVKGILPTNGLVTVYGPPKCGKSFFTFDLTMHVALGIDYRGRRVTQGTVVYCAFEGVTGFSARVEAFRQRRLAEDHEDVPFFLMTTPMVLAADVSDFIAAVRAQLGDEASPAIVVLDTLNRCYLGSENDDKDMNAFIKAADRVRVELDCTVVVIHHSGIAGDRPRGHTSLGGAVDALIAVRKTADGTLTTTIEWMKDGGEGEVVASRLEVVEVGRDDLGEPITSCVVEPVERGGERPQPAGRRMGDRHRLALAALAESVLAHGKPLPAAFGIAGDVKAAPVERWREELHARGVIDSEDKNPRATFKRLKEALTARSLVAERDGFIWSAISL